MVREDALITVLSSNKFSNAPITTFRLIEQSDDYIQGFYEGIRQCYPVNVVQLTKIK